MAEAPFETTFIEFGTEAWEALPAEERARRTNAALTIQKHFRRHAVCSTLEVMSDVTTTMQSLARGFLARKQVKEKKKHHHHQKHHRRNSGSGGHKEMTVMEEVRAALHETPPDAAGSKGRGLKGHPSTSQFDGASLEAAIMTQNEEIARREREQAATKLQALQRGKKARQKHHKHKAKDEGKEKEKGQREAAATKVQAAHRGKETRQKHHKKKTAEAPAPASPVVSDSPWACFGGRRGKVCGLDTFTGDAFNTPLLNALLASAWGNRACLPLGPREVRSPQVPSQAMPGTAATPESKSKAKKHHRSSSGDS